MPFTAYAFNKDRVESKTARNDTYKVPDDIPLRYTTRLRLNGRSEHLRQPNRRCRAVNDADALAASLGRIQGYQVVSISLLSDTGHLRGKAKEMPLNQATKANIRAVLHVLAGKNAGAERERLQGRGRH